MNSSTHTLLLDAPKDKVFDFLACVDNLPKWATQFCRALRRDEYGRTKVVTPQGEIFFKIAADRATGIVDMFGGPSENEMAYWPARVLARPDNGSVFVFTAFQYPGVSDAEFAAQCAGLAHEFPRIKALTE